MASLPGVTELLLAWGDGDHASLDKLDPLVHDELHRLAAHYLRRERPNHTLQPTALVNEAYLRLVNQTRTRWQDRAHFFGAAQVMRRILVYHARQHAAAKRGEGGQNVTLDEGVALGQGRDVSLLALDEALNRLEEMESPQKWRSSTMRHFCGLSIEETAEVLGVSTATVTRQWRTAKAWLHRELVKGPRPE